MDLIKPAEEKKPSKKSGLKAKILFSIGCLGVICVGILLIVTAFLWYGGHIQKFTCKTVEEDSQIWDRLSCGDDKQTPDVTQEGEGEFKYNVKDDSEIIVNDLEEVVVRVVEESAPSVVGIGFHGEGSTEDQIIGSGFVITENGLIVTNHHVVSDGEASNYFVVINGSKELNEVQEIYRDELNDMAILKIDQEGLKPLPLGDSDELKVGQTVIAIGNPLGNLTGTVTVGNISGLNRDVNVGSNNEFNLSQEYFSEVIQTDAAINPGNSGGPLINSNGEVIGINFATIRGADNLSFALPINRVKDRINELNEFGDFRIPFLGIEYRRRLVFFEEEAIVGASVINVSPNSPAAEGGLKSGDVIIRFNGKSLEDNSLLTLIQQSEIGSEVEVVVVRGGKSVTLQVMIGDRSKVLPPTVTPSATVAPTN